MIGSLVVYFNFTPLSALTAYAAVQYGVVRSYTAKNLLSLCTIERTSSEHCTCTVQVQCALQLFCSPMLGLTLNSARAQYSCE